MPDFLPTLLAFPPYKGTLNSKDYDTRIKSFLKDLNHFPSSAWITPVSQRNILELLDPSVNSLSYLFALLRNIDAAVKDPQRLDALIPLAAIFLTSFDPIQVRYAGEQWRMLWETVCQAIASSGSTDVSPLVTSLLRLDLSAGTFTTNHLRLVRLCLQLGVPSQALPILDRNIYAYPQHPNKSIPEDFLCEENELSNTFITARSGFSLKVVPEFVIEYYLLGAHVYIGLRNYSRARLFLEYVLLSPSIQHAASALQVEAYKKWVLIGLLADGKTFPLPRTADQAIIKNLQSMSKAYDALADSFVRRNWKKYQADLDAGSQVWIEDGNLRLVKEVGEALVRYRVIDLQKMYAALPISRVATHLDLATGETLSLLTGMIARNQLSASISTSGAEAVLRFDLDTSNTLEAVDLDAQTRRIADLTAFVRDADRRLQLTREHVEHQKRAKRAAGPDGDVTDMMDLSWDAPMSQRPIDDEGDEDIMAA